MVLNYEKLIELEKDPEVTTSNFRNVKLLDKWLTSLNRSRADNINPLQFAIDMEISKSDALTTIGLVYKKTQLFKKFFRLLSSTNEVLEDTFNFSFDEDPRDDGLYSYERDEYLYGAEISVALFYKLTDVPIYRPSTEKKVIAPSFTEQIAKKDNVYSSYMNLMGL